MQINDISIRHSGDAGDLISGMPAMRALGVSVVYLEAATYTRVMMTRENWRGLDRILLDQPYIKEVHEWRNHYTSFNGNDWRMRLMKSLRVGQHKDKSLVDWQLEQFNLPLSAKDEPWITIKEPATCARVVFNRTGAGRPAGHVYHNDLFPWARVVEKYGKEAAFVGTELEHRVFCAQHGYVPRIDTKDLYDVARVIAGCELFVGNQSCPYWLAAGMFKPLILEVWKNGPNSLLNRPNAIMAWDDTINLPDL